MLTSFDELTQTMSPVSRSHPSASSRLRVRFFDDFTLSIFVATTVCGISSCLLYTSDAADD